MKNKTDKLQMRQTGCKKGQTDFKDRHAIQKQQFRNWTDRIYL